MTTLLKAYQKISVKFPICVQAVQTGILMGSGDLIAQFFVERQSFRNIDILRAGQYTLTGTLLVGPPLRIWYGILEKYFGSKGKMAALKKVTADQLLFAPGFLFLIMGTLRIMQGNSLDVVIERTKQDYPDVLKNNYKIWPAVQLFNFYVVPLQYQVVFVQFVAIIWNTYLSWKMNKSTPMRSLVEL